MIDCLSACNAPLKLQERAGNWHHNKSPSLVQTLKCRNLSSKRRTRSRYDGNNPIATPPPLSVTGTGSDSAVLYSLSLLSDRTSAGTILCCLCTLAGSHSAGFLALVALQNKINPDALKPKETDTNLAPPHLLFLELSASIFSQSSPAQPSSAQVAPRVSLSTQTTERFSARKPHAPWSLLESDARLTWNLGTHPSPAYVQHYISSWVPNLCDRTPSFTLAPSKLCLIAGKQDIPDPARSALPRTKTPGLLELVRITHPK